MTSSCPLPNSVFKPLSLHSHGSVEACFFCCITTTHVYQGHLLPHLVTQCFHRLLRHWTHGLSVLLPGWHQHPCGFLVTTIHVIFLSSPLSYRILWPHLHPCHYLGIFSMCETINGNIPFSDPDLPILIGFFVCHCIFPSSILCLHWYNYKYRGFSILAPLEFLIISFLSSLFPYSFKQVNFIKVYNILYYSSILSVLYNDF